MKKSFYKSELTKKSLGLGAVLFIGIGAHSFAQTPPPLPPLSALPDMAAAANGVPALPPLASPVAGDTKTTSAAVHTALPELLPLPGAAPKAAVATTAKASTASAPTTAAAAPFPELMPLPDVVSQSPAAPASTVTHAAPKADAANDGLPALADLPEPDMPAEKPVRPKVASTDKGKAPTETAAENKDTAPATSTAGIPALPALFPLLGGASTSAPVTENASGVPPLPMIDSAPKSSQHIKISEDDHQKKSWQVTLEPTDVPVETRFNFRRQMLPSTIYTTQYSEENQHLPVAVTRQNYEELLFSSVTNNDVESTRSLLNAGTNIDAVNGNGQTLVAVAHMAGAEATEKLLLARGGR